MDTIFGYPGGAIIDLYDQLVKTDIRHIMVRHEQGAVHAADGYARAAGKVGVCLVTSGPGATNTVSGIASAYMDSIPVVILTGQVPTSLVKNVDDLSRVIQEAFHIARSGRPGPVLVDIPKDLLKATAQYKPLKEVDLKSYNPNYEPNVKQLPKVIDLIKEASRPVIFSGGGVILSGGWKELREFARKIQAPVTSTLMGLGAFPASDPLWLGMIGMHGTYCANMSTSECDLLIAVGVRFDDRVTGKIDAFAPNARIVHIDIDPTSIRKNIRVSVPIVGDCRITLHKLNRMLDAESLGHVKERREPWRRQIEEWKRTKPLAYTLDDRVIKPQYVIEKGPEPDVDSPVFPV